MRQSATVARAVSDTAEATLSTLSGAGLTSAGTATPQPAPPLVAQSPDSDDTGQIELEIRHLWKSCRETSAANSAMRKTLTQAKHQLEEKLSHYKQATVGTGRGGKWSSFLRDLGISKTTADRCVKRFLDRTARETAGPNGKLVTDELSTSAISKLAQKWAALLHKRGFSGDHLVSLQTQLAHAFHHSGIKH